jgi:endoglucanase Acf2
MKKTVSIVAVACLIGLLAACSGGSDAPDSTATSVALAGPTPALAGTVEVGGEITDQTSQGTATGVTVVVKSASGTRLLAQTTSAEGNQLTAISKSDPQSILGSSRIVANPFNPKDIKELQLVSLPPGTRTRLPTGKWSKGFFYQSPVNLNAYFAPKPAQDPNNEGADINQFSVFAFPNKLNLDDRLGMVAVSFPARRYIAYGIDPNADVYNLRNPFRADTLLYHIAPNFNQDIRLGHAPTTAARLTRKIDAFDELTVSTSWYDAAGKQRMQLIAAEGSPYVTVRYAGLRPVVQVGQGSQARREKSLDTGLPLTPEVVDYTQQESVNEIVAVAVGEEPLKRFIESNTIRTAPSLTLTGTKFRFVYETPDRAQAMPGTNDNREIAPLRVYKELVVYASSPITLAWDTPSRSYVATSEFNGVLRTAFVDDVRKASETEPAIETISDIPSFRNRRAILDRYAATFPTSSEIFVDYAGATGTVRYKWAMERMDGQTAQGSDLLMMGFDATHIPSLRNATRVDGLSYRSNFGMMSAVAGNEWAQTLTIPEILRNGAPGSALWMGAGTIKSTEELQRLLKSLDKDTELFTEQFLTTTNADSYISGKYLHNVSRMAVIANYLAGENRLSPDDRATAAAKRGQLLDYLKRSMSLWLDGKDANGAPIDPVANMTDDTFVYDTTNGGLITSLGLKDRLKDYTNREYVDHMFHYGYFIYTAAVIAQLDPTSGWLEANREKVNLLVRDIANPSLEDTHFPIVRTFDWFRMQNIADAGPDANGGNTESSSESVNSNYALLTWGIALKDDAFQALAAIMSAAEIRTAQAFYQITPQTAYLQQPNLDYPEVSSVTVHLPNGDSSIAIKPSSEPVMNILRANIAETNTFFGPLLANRIGINLLPITPMSDYIISRDWAKAHEKTLLDLENRNSAQFAQLINTVPSVSADCFTAAWNFNDPPKNPDGTPEQPNAGAICAGRLRVLYSWRQLLVAANALNDPNGAYQRYTDIMDRLDADQKTYQANTDRLKYPGSSLNDGGVVADVLKDISTPSTNTNTLWWLMTHK